MNTQDIALAKAAGKIKFADSTAETFTNNLAELAKSKPDIELNLAERHRLYRYAVEKKAQFRDKDKDLLDYARRMLIVTEKQITQQTALQRAELDRITQRTLFNQIEEEGRTEEPIVGGDPTSRTIGEALDPENNDPEGDGTGEADEDKQLERDLGVVPDPLPHSNPTNTD
jgi:hypothetical protein